ncbi:MAG: DUF559 domain-containing protein [Geodermatophilaceae bacterium]|nr:DUF559 domain-containing protein [Geodermatophilaceae bacterium]
MATPRIPAVLRERPFRGRDALAEGLVSRRRLLGPEFRRVLHGVYVVAGVTIDHGLRCQAAALVLPPESVLTGHSAAWWYGVSFARDDAVVMVARPPGTRVDGPRGIKVHRTPVQVADIAVVDGMRVTSPVRAAWDVCTLTEAAPALAIVDGLLHRSALSDNELGVRLASGVGAWGVTRAREVFNLANGRSESPSETHVRLTMHRAGIPPPVLQFEVWVEGTFVARVDFAWPEQRVILEYDGAHHADLLQMRRDRRRLNDLVNAGWVVLHATASDLRDPTGLLRSLRTALARPAA